MEYDEKFEEDDVIPPLSISFSTEVAKALSAFATSGGRRPDAYQEGEEENCHLFGWQQGAGARRQGGYAVVAVVFARAGDLRAVREALAVLPVGVRPLGRALRPDDLLSSLALSTAEPPDDDELPPQSSASAALATVSLTVHLAAEGLTEGCVIQASTATGERLVVGAHKIEPMSVICQNTVLLTVEYKEIVSLMITDSMTKREVQQIVKEKFIRMKDRITSSASFFLPVRRSTDVCLLLPSKAVDEPEDALLAEPFRPTSTVFDLWKAIEEHATDEKTRRTCLSFDKDSIQFEQRRKLGIEKTEFENEEQCVPILHIQREKYLVFKIPIRLRGLTICNQNIPLISIGGMLTESLNKQLSSAKKCLYDFSDFTANKFEAVVPYVFLPSRDGVFLSLHYPSQKTDQMLEPSRRKLHVLFNLPLDRPMFRKANAYPLGRTAGHLLRNIHEYAKASGLSNAETTTVVGAYHFHHYMQDGVEDSGWGCAYRSFQTIWSWYLLQAYTQLPVPTHRQIQQVLVDIGDKPANFVGSRQWVGSLELSWCLENMLGIESRISRVESGAEMADKARELMMHFQTEGTPVMIGGGVLAHTILGVAMDTAETGEARFLVLDPHYTGQDDVAAAIKAGGCAWKSVAFWSADAFYNMLLPKRPRML